MPAEVLTQAPESVQLLQLRQEIARLKRSRTVSDENSGKNSGKAKKISSPAATTGRAYRRAVDTFLCPAALVAESDRREAVEANEVDDINVFDESGLSEKQVAVKQVEVQTRNRTFQSFICLKKLFPALDEILSGSDHKVLLKFYSDILKGANNARSDDLRRVSSRIADMLNYPPWSANPPLTIASRLQRGLQHNTTGMLLTPIVFNWEKDHVKIRAYEKSYSINCCFYARCFYPTSAGTPKDLEIDFLRSELLVQSFRLVFISPSSEPEVEPLLTSSSGDATQASLPSPAKKSKKEGNRANVATLCDMQMEVAPRNIAYVAVLLHMSLTDLSQWSHQWNGYKYNMLYNFIVNFFEGPMGPVARARADDLLKWWNKKIFPAPNYDACDTQLLSIAMLLKQRDVRESEGIGLGLSS